MPNLSPSRSHSRHPIVQKPAKREWLTDEEISDAIEDFLEDNVPPERLYKKSFLRAIEKAEREIKAGKGIPFHPNELLKI